jgi:hypothetical protein
MRAHRDGNDLCYLLAWIVEKDGQLVVDGAGIYSEPPGTITHSLNKTSPVIVETTEGPDYHAARIEMDALIKYYLGLNIPSVRRKIFEMVLQERD